MTRVDVVVVGLGAVGSATAWQLARRGRRVVGVEQHEPDHVFGSSHGASRIFRLAYEHDDYVRFASEALPLWRRIEQEAAVQILTQTGSVDFGNDRAIASIAAALQRNDLPVEVLDTVTAQRRWPGIRFSGSVLHSPDGGRTDADAARAALQRLAAEAGADLRFSTPVVNVQRSAGGVRVVTHSGEVEAAIAVVTVNAWAATLLRGLVPLPPIRVTQEQPAFFRPHDPAMPWPSFIHYVGEATRAADVGCYGLMSPGDGGVKVGEHGTGVLVAPDGERPPVDPGRLERVSDYVEANLPGLHPEPLHAVRCLYATTPSEDFILDRLGSVVVGVGFSGHGFKFVPALGRLLADLADGSGRPAARFRLPR